MAPMHIGLLCAMPEEIGSTIGNLQNTTETFWGDLKITSGEWFDSGASAPSVYISAAWSGWGKVSAARAATRILGTHFNQRPVDLLLFTGVAGSAKKMLTDYVIKGKIVWIVITDELKEPSFPSIHPKIGDEKSFKFNPIKIIPITQY